MPQQPRDPESPAMRPPRRLPRLPAAVAGDSTRMRPTLRKPLPGVNGSRRRSHGSHGRHVGPSPVIQRRAGKQHQVAQSELAVHDDYGRMMSMSPDPPVEAGAAVHRRRLRHTDRRGSTPLIHLSQKRVDLKSRIRRRSRSLPGRRQAGDDRSGPSLDDPLTGAGRVGTVVKPPPRVLRWSGRGGRGLG